MSEIIDFATVKTTIKNEIDPIAAIALLIAVISFVIALMTYLRDRANAKVVVFRNAIIPGKKLNKKIASISVTNVGRRPITISIVGYRNLWDFKLTAVIPTAHQQQNPHRLEEADTKTYIIEKDLMLPDGKWKGVAYVLVSDSAGKEYTANIAPFPLLWFHRLLEKVVWPFMRMRTRLKRQDD
jgi:hypothetical protein